MNDQAYANAVKKTLLDCIEDLDSIKNLFLRNPETDFTRNRKIPFPTLIKAMLMIDGGSLQNELISYFDYSYDVPTKSAYCQQRAKLFSDAVSFLFSEFTQRLRTLDSLKLFHGYRVLAVDGSDINIPYNPQDIESFQKNGDNKGFNQLHLNALMDVLNGFYDDAILEPDKKSHERIAFLTMADRYRSSIPSIFLGDRGYECYQILGHLIRSGHKFLIRLKAPDSNGILSSHRFPDGEFDLDLETILTHRQTKEVLANKDIYTVIPDASKCDFFEPGNPFFPLKLRVICIKISDGVFEYFATNLERDEFPPNMIKHLYHLRWNEESSFRELKYTIDILHFHGKKREFVEQEAWARLIIYNFCEAITRHIAVSKQRNPKPKYDQKINFATAACICKTFLKRSDGEINPCRLIGRFLIPIRPDRSAPRKIKPQSAKTFLYRAA